MFKHLLAPLDGSITAECTLPHLVALARRYRVEPCIPPHWESYEMTLRHGTALYRISVNNPTGVCRGVTQVTLDGDERPDGVIPLCDDGAEHAVTVHLGTVI